MARGKTLESILSDFRAEARISSNAAHNKGARDDQINLICRQQEWLWADFDWPHLRVDRYIELSAGQYLYDMPADLDIDRIQKIEVKFGGSYRPLDIGIEAEHYATYDTEQDERSWPIRRCRIAEGEMLEVWPVPSENYDSENGNGRIKIRGIRQLSTFVSVSDTADLDDRLISLHAAAEYLSAKGSEDAQLKLEKATKLYLRLRGHQMLSRRVRLFGTSSSRRRRSPPMAIYNATS